MSAYFFWCLAFGILLGGSASANPLVFDGPGAKFTWAFLWGVAFGTILGAGLMRWLIRRLDDHDRL
jgi:NhaP-type Na+/H+ or K+/H+ antiporter